MTKVKQTCPFCKKVFSAFALVEGDIPVVELELDEYVAKHEIKCKKGA